MPSTLVEASFFLLLLWVLKGCADAAIAASTLVWPIGKGISHWVPEQDYALLCCYDSLKFCQLGAKGAAIIATVA